QVRELCTVNPAAVGQPDSIDFATEDFLKGEGRKPGAASRREPACIADSISEHRHRICVKLCDQDRRLGAGRLGLDEQIRPVNFEVGYSAFRLKTDATAVASAVAFAYRSSERRFDHRAVMRQEFFSAGHYAYRRIRRLIVVVEYEFGQLAD